MPSPVIVRVNVSATAVDLASQQVLGAVPFEGTAFEFERGVFASAWHVWAGPYPVLGYIIELTNPTVSVAGAPASNLTNYYGFAPTLNVPFISADLATFEASTSTAANQLIGLAAFVSPTVEQLVKFASVVYDDGQPSDQRFSGLLTGSIKAVGSGIAPDPALNPINMVSANITTTEGRSGHTR